MLSRRLSDAGHYPAIDIEASISRAMGDVTDPEQQRAARDFKRTYSTYQQNRDLISVGAYQRGSDEQIDVAIGAIPRLLDFLRQDMREQVTIEESLEALYALFPQSTVAALRARGAS